MTDTKRTKLVLSKGVVASVSGNKTVRVKLDYLTRHPKYGKFLRRSTWAHVHDENNQAKVGDNVEIAKCRPISKSKNWRLIRVLN